VENEPEPNPAASPQGRITPFAIFGIIVGALLVAMMLSICSSPGRGTGGARDAAITPETPQQKAEARWNSNEGKVDAFSMSQKFIKERLKSPGSAEFPSITDSDVVITHKGGGRFTVKAYVDSQNAFGALLRTRYTCEIRDNGDRTWALLSMDAK